MIYSCDDYRSVSACESGRLYDDDFDVGERESKYCPNCNTPNPEIFYCDSYNECIGCSECITTIDWNNF